MFFRKQGFVVLRKPPVVQGVLKSFSVAKKNSFDKIDAVRRKHKKSKEVSLMDVNSLAHTKWNCKYHVVFAPKFRRKVIYNQLRVDIGKILRMLCDRKGIEIIEAEVCPDHVHMLISVPPKMSIAGVMGYIKGKSTLLIFERHADMKYKYGQRQFWCRGYYVDTVGKNTKAIKEYIANQLKEDKLKDDLSSKEYIDPFTGKKVKQMKLFK